MFLHHCCQRILFAIAVIFLAAIVPTQLLAAEVNFSWLPNSETNLAGYKIHYGTAARNYTSVIDVGLPDPIDGRIQASVDGLTEEQIYYFAATAYDTDGVESDYSEEIMHTVATDPGLPGETITKTFGNTPDTDFPNTIADTFTNINDQILEGSQTLSTWSWSSPSPHKVANTIILKSDLISIPSSATVLEARIYLYQTDAHGLTTYKNSAHLITGKNPVIAQVNGYNASSNVAWNSVPSGTTYNDVPLGLGDIATAEDEVILGETTGYQSWLITNMVQTWVANPESNFGLLINGETGVLSETGRTFAATEHTDSTIRPKLIVRYQLNPDTTPPVANDSSTDGVEDIPFGGNLDVTNPSGLPITYTVKTSPVHGMLSIEDATGYFTYTPFTDFYGTDSFTFTASNDNGESNTATVTLTITPVNDAPSASAASLITDEDLSVSGQLNATDVDDDTLNFTLVTAPSKGTVTLNVTGTFTYQPDDDISGTDSFTYKVNDGSADSNTATVTITINPTNDAPITQNSSISVDEDASVSGQLNATDVDGDTLTYIQVSTATKGALAQNADGSFTYSPNVNVSGTDSFTYKVNDGSADSNTATVIITINPINDTPTADNASLTVNAGATVTGQLIAGDVDGDSLSYNLTGTPTKGSAVVNTNGSFTYTANGDAEGTDSFSFKANDGMADSNTATVTITINQVNDAPVAQNSSLSLDAGSSINGQLTANDNDNDPLNFLLVTSPEKGSITLNANGSFTYTANSATEGTDTFSFKANDGILDSNIATVTITINPAALRFELGELQVSSEWQQVLFSEPFITPVVIARAASVNDIEPGVVRVRNVTETGFEVRFQEWDALDGEHPAEIVTFMVMEQGRFALDDGTEIEAGCFSTTNAAGFSQISFSQSMNAVPVVMAAVTSENEIDAVTMRIKNITTGGFEQKMQEQESNATDHSTESACYIAWEPSKGRFTDMNYEIATTPAEVTDSGYTIHYNQIFTEAPILLASMQSTNGGDTATLRSSASKVDSVDVRVSEEQSRDSETSHAAETAGYIAFGNFDLTSDSDGDGLLTGDEINTYTTHPGLIDTDKDGLTDGEEVAYWQDHGIDWAGDIDNDGTINLIDGDADGDGVLDGVEVAAGFDPADPASAPTFPLLDAGEIDVDHNWVHVQIQASFVQPVIVARLISANDPEPCVVRIANTTADGFDIRLQEYDYQDDIHAVEQVSFIVMEAGNYTLTDGTRIEAGSFQTNATKTYEVYGFAQTFQEVPVVITAIGSYNEEDTVTGRMRKITTTGFDYKLQEQEANKQAHLQETISYIAWEPSAGSELEISYEVSRSGDVVTHLPATVPYTSQFNQAPLLLTDMQTNDGGNTASLRLINNTPGEMQLFVQEEQSKDDEISHTAEVAGFIAIQAE